MAEKTFETLLPGTDGGASTIGTGAQPVAARSATGPTATSQYIQTAAPAASQQPLTAETVAPSEAVAAATGQAVAPWSGPVAVTVAPAGVVLPDVFSTMDGSHGIRGAGHGALGSGLTELLSMEHPSGPAATSPTIPSLTSAAQAPAAPTDAPSSPFGAIGTGLSGSFSPPSTALFLAILMALFCLPYLRYGKVVLAPARWRPVLFVSLLERPG